MLAILIDIVAFALCVMHDFALMPMLLLVHSWTQYCKHPLQTDLTTCFLPASVPVKRNVLSVRSQPQVVGETLSSIMSGSVD